MYSDGTTKARCFEVTRYPTETPPCNFCKHPGPHKLLETNVKNTQHDFVECPGCRLRFYSPRRTFKSLLDCGFGTDEGARKEAETFYKYLSFVPVASREHQEKTLRSYYGNMLDTVTLRARKLESLFEIGGTIGFFLLLAKERGLVTGGCELNYFAVDVGRQAWGLDGVHKGVFADFVPQRTYDCVTALDYIEHTFTPYDDLKKMYGMLNPGGAVLLKTFLEELDTDRGMVAPPCHSHHFFGDVLRAMIEACGFRITDWRIDFIEQVQVVAVKP